MSNAGTLPFSTLPYFGTASWLRKLRKDRQTMLYDPAFSSLLFGQSSVPLMMSLIQERMYSVCRLQERRLMLVGS